MTIGAAERPSQTRWSTTESGVPSVVHEVSPPRLPRPSRVPLPGHDGLPNRLPLPRARLPGRRGQPHCRGRLGSQRRSTATPSRRRLRRCCHCGGRCPLRAQNTLFPRRFGCRSVPALRIPGGPRPARIPLRPSRHSTGGWRRWPPSENLALKCSVGSCAELKATGSGEVLGLGGHTGVADQWTGRGLSRHG